jgi:hypothetical protein
MFITTEFEVTVMQSYQTSFHISIIICDLADQFLFYFTVNLTGRGRVDMSNFELLKVLGTGGTITNSLINLSLPPFFL